MDKSSSLEKFCCASEKKCFGYLKRQCLPFNIKKSALVVKRAVLWEDLYY